MGGLAVDLGNACNPDAPARSVAVKGVPGADRSEGFWGAGVRTQGLGERMAMQGRGPEDALQRIPLVVGSCGLSVQAER